MKTEPRRKTPSDNRKLPPATSLAPRWKRWINVHEALATAVEYQKAGCLKEAEAIYRQILEIQHDNVEALYLLGRIAFGSGRSDIAVDYISKAISLNHTNAAFHNDLGTILMYIGKSEEATASYRQALAIKPDYADAHYNLANLLVEQGMIEEAITSYRQALAIKPDYVKAHINLGNALTAQGNLDEAIASYRRAIGLETKQADAHNNLGYALTAQGNLDEAITSYRQALAIKPDHADAYYNLGNSLADQGKPDAAIECYKEVLRLMPDYVKAYNNLGNTFKSQGKLDAAIDCYNRAIDLEPCYAEAHLNKALALLLSGKFAEGWSEYEWRFQVDGVVRQTGQRRLEWTRWDGSPLAGKNIVVLSEQGLGDTIQFIRYLPLVQARHGCVIFLCQKELVRLLKNYPGINVLLGESDSGWPEVAFDAYIPLLSLPRIFDTTMETVVAEVPYLKADPKRIEAWHSQLDGQDLKIGLVWAGNPRHKNDCKRSCPLSAFSPLARIAGITFYSLQKLSFGEQTVHPPEGMTLIDLSGKLGDFAETAGLISNLDLIISVDTAVAHLAGAMARPVWTILPFAPDWRWLLDREDSPWYPTMRLFRQPKPGDWDTVIQRVAHELAELIQRSTMDGSPKGDCNV